MEGAIHTFKSRLIAKGFTQTYRVDYEETFSPVADIRAIRILIAITTFYDYEIWQMDVKTAFLNGHLSEEVYMTQHEGEAAYILGIKIYRDRSKWLISLCQSAYIEKILKRYYMKNSKRRTILMQDKLKLSKSDGASTPAEKWRMSNVPYALAVGSIMYATTVKNILKYLWNTKDMFLVYGGDMKRELMVSCYTDAGYLTNADDLKTRNNVLCNTGAIAIANDHGVTKGARHFHAKVHYLRETIELGDVRIEKVNTDDNLADPFTKALAFPKHSELTRKFGLIPASCKCECLLDVSIASMNADCYTNSQVGAVGKSPAIFGLSTNTQWLLQTEDQFFFSGDSLFDPGNNNYINTTPVFQANYLPYGESYFSPPTGRFSNGHLISDFSGEPYGNIIFTLVFPVVDLQTQLRYFIDVENLYRQSLGDTKAEQLLSNAGIYEKGGRKFVFLKGPLIGCFSKPLRIGQPGNTCNQEMNDIVTLHNQKLARKLKHLEKQLDVQVIAYEEQENPKTPRIVGATILKEKRKAIRAVCEEWLEPEVLWDICKSGRRRNACSRCCMAYPGGIREAMVESNNVSRGLEKIA
ncbi:retrotransposon protein, putative, ty1-copia subclass [Tanacetum coccineum]